MNLINFAKIVPKEVEKHYSCRGVGGVIIHPPLLFFLHNFSCVRARDRKWYEFLNKVNSVKLFFCHQTLAEYFFKSD